MRSTIEILDRLVAYDTTSRNSNLDLIDWVTPYLTSHGVESTRLYDETGSKASLVARIGPERTDGVVLCGHTDVVPVDGQPWSGDPFRLTRLGDRLHGRGTTDMKGFIAAALAVVPELAQADLVRPVTLALTYDEEVGCLGAAALAEYLVNEQPRPALVMVGEPTSMRVARAHKAVRVLRTTVTGRDTHSSRTDQGASAISAAARLVAYIDELAEQLAAEGVRRAGFEPEYTTINVGTIAGGQALNIVPRLCGFEWEYRCVSGEDADDIQRRVESFAQAHVLPRLREVAPEADIVTEQLSDVPALEPDGNATAADVLLAMGLREATQSVSFGTDASALQRAGLPTVVCGPGSMAQGHQVDEYIEISELARCDEFFRGLVQWAAAAPVANSL